MKKKLYLCIFLMLMVLLTVACQSSLYQKDLETIESHKMLGQEVTVQPEPMPDQKIDYTAEETNRLATDFKKKWQAVDRQLSSLSESKDSDGVKRYSEGEALRKLEIEHETYGSRDMDYKREYFFDDTEMYFARLTNGTKEMRFYFKDGRLIRWLDATGRFYDEEKDHKDFSVYEAQLLSEATDLWSEFNSEKTIVNSYIQ